MLDDELDRQRIQEHAVSPPARIASRNTSRSGLSITHEDTDTEAGSVPTNNSGHLNL